MSDPQLQFTDPMPLRLAAVYSDTSEQRLRALMREGKIKATKTDQGAWMITKAVLDAYKATKGTRTGGGGSRGDGKSYVIHVQAKLHDEVEAFLKKLGIGLEPRYNYAKQKAYQEKRKADKAKVKTLPVDAGAMGAGVAKSPLFSK